MGYTVCFEDDVELCPNFQNILINLINTMPDFDLIFLGSINNAKGDKFKDNIYKINGRCYGAHAMLINNKYAQKIYEKICVVDSEGDIDLRYSDLSSAGELNGYIINPSIAKQSGLDTTIWL